MYKSDKRRPDYDHEILTMCQRDNLFMNIFFDKITTLHRGKKKIATFSKMNKPKVAIFNQHHKLILITHNDSSATLWDLNDNMIAIFNHSFDIKNAKFFREQDTFCILVESAESNVNNLLLWRKHFYKNESIKQVLLRKVLNLYVKTKKRKSVANIEQMNTFLESVAEAFNLDSKELISIWDTFNMKQKPITNIEQVNKFCESAADFEYEKENFESDDFENLIEKFNNLDSKERISIVKEKVNNKFNNEFNNDSIKRAIFNNIMKRAIK